MSRFLLWLSLLLLCTRFPYVSAFLATGSVSACRSPLALKAGGRELDPSLEVRVDEAMKALSADLPRQYQQPLMDYGIYRNDILFEDPVTKLKGKLLYVGMITTICGFLKVACKANPAPFFDLQKIERVDSESLIRTEWNTEATTKWGAELRISGVDDFVYDDDGSIFQHLSRWETEPGQLWRMIRGKGATSS